MGLRNCAGSVEIRLVLRGPSPQLRVTECWSSTLPSDDFRTAVGKGMNRGCRALMPKYWGRMLSLIYYYLRSLRKEKPAGSASEVTLP